LISGSPTTPAALRHDEIATQRQLEPAAEGKPVERGDGRLGKIVDPAIGFVLERKLLRHHGAGRHHAREFPDVGPGAEGLGAGPGQHHDPDAWIPRQPGHQRVEIAGEVQGHEVERRIVQGDERHPVLDGAQHEFPGHDLAPGRWATAPIMARQEPERNALGRGR
jgi:hypothetical protein